MFISSKITGLDDENLYTYRDGFIRKGCALVIDLHNDSKLGFRLGAQLSEKLLILELFDKRWYREGKSDETRVWRPIKRRLMYSR